MITVVVPVFNEKDNIGPLLAEINAAAALSPISEILYVDDASTDGSLEVLKNVRFNHPRLRVIRHEKQSGQSAALRTGAHAAKGELIVTLDGDGQNDPGDIKKLYDLYKGQTNPAVMVAGQRLRRHDTWIRRISSRIANGVRSKMLKDGTRDTGCSLKLFRREDYLTLPYFDHMHRFLPALMMREGVRIVHADVSHRPRLHGQSKYATLDRLFVGITDLWGVRWLQKRARRAESWHEEL